MHNPYISVQGYRQFDPSRGASYQLDLEVKLDNIGNKEAAATEHRRVNVMRPLGLAEILPMPYVTEAARLNLAVAFTSGDDMSRLVVFYMYA